MTDKHADIDKAERFLNQLIDILSRQGLKLGPDQINYINVEIDRIVHYQATIGVMGKSGAGKSALCNALFGQEVAKVSDIDAGTHEPQFTPAFDQDGRNIRLLDMPGVGDSLGNETRYRQMYQHILPTVDLVLWVVKGDDRALSVDEHFYQQVLLPEIEARQLPVIFVISQVDKMAPSKDWNTGNNRPGIFQYSNICAKKLQICQRFNIKRDQVCAISTAANYGLSQLMELIITMTPHEKRWGVAREAQQDKVNEKAWHATTWGLWIALKRKIASIALSAWEKLAEKLSILADCWARY